jgi:anion transporter
MASRATDGAVTAPAPEALEALLRNVPYYRDLSRLDIARLIGELEEVTITAGTLLFPEGAPADSMYLLASGRVSVSIPTTTGERGLAELQAPSYFGEIGLLLTRRAAAVRALSDARLWKLPRERFEQFVRERPAVGLAVATAAVQLLERSQRSLVGAPLVELPERSVPAIGVPVRGRSLTWRIASFAVACGVPLLLWQVPTPGGLTLAGWHASLIVLGAALGWLLEPLPDYVTALLMAAGWGIANLAPPELIFAGFASSAWLVSVGAFALAVAMVRSGLLYRIALLFLRTFPSTQAGQVLALLTSGIVITPLVPLGLARVAVVAPLAHDLAQALGYPTRSRASAALAFAGLAGYGLFSSVFLTGLVMNFFILNVFPAPDQTRFGWLTWLACAAPAGAILLLGTAGLLLVAFRAEVAPRRRAELLRHQQRVLGPLSRQERVTLAALLVLLVGLLAQPLLHVDTAWLAIGAVAVATAGGSLDRERFRGAIDWGFLTMFGVLLGTPGVLHHSGVDAWIARSLVPLAQAAGSPGTLVVLLGVFVVACRLVLPWIPATLLLGLALVPAGPQLGLSPWVVGFIVLTAANTWLHPNQSDFCRLTQEATGGEMFSHRHGIIMGAGITLLTLAALATSVPYWSALGVLTP